MSKLITSKEAVKRLTDIGYHVEHANGIVYARLRNEKGHGTGIPDRVYESRAAGLVSEMAVRKLENKMARRLA